MKVSTRIIVLTLFAILISAVGSSLTVQQTSACGGLAQAVDCYDAASLSYSPSNPGPGDYVYINVVIDATVSNAPGFSETLYVDGQVHNHNQQTGQTMYRIEFKATSGKTQLKYQHLDAGRAKQLLKQVLGKVVR